MDFKKLNDLSILSVAYLGDSIWEVKIRDYFVRKNLNIKDLNDLVRNYVNAKSQSKFYLAIFDDLEPQFQAYSKRGRNANINSYPKSCTPKEYRSATAFEVLIGAYHLLGEVEKMEELTKKIIEGDLVEKKFKLGMKSGSKKGFFKINKSIGIDLGTANTLVYHRQKNDIVLNEPSVVAVDKDTKKVLAVGHEAKDMIGKTPDNIIAVRPLREGVIADYDITEAMIKYFIKKVFGNFNILSPEVMICVPIEVTGVEKRAVLEAAISAGAKRAYLIEEARAAALGSGIDIAAPEGSMIVDIGGGSTDIAVISLGGTVVSKSIRIAGNNFDEDIIRYVKKVHNLLIGDRTAEYIKINIGAALPLEDEEYLEVKGRDLVSGLPKTIRLSSSEVLEAINDSLMQIVNNVKTVLEKTPPELAADIVDKGIVMTGGGALIRDFTKLLSNYTQLPVYLAENCLESVVLGAGMALDKLDVLRKIEKEER